MPPDALTEFLAKAKAFTLTPAERENGRAALRAAQVKTALALQPDEKEAFRQELLRSMRAGSPPRVQEPHAPWWSAVSLFLLRMPAMAALGLVLLGASGFGLAYAAEDALPGDVLYPIKLHVTEPIIGTFQRTPEQQAAWAVEQVRRRLAEVHSRAELPLTDDDAAAMATIVTKYTRYASERVDNVSVQSPDAARSLRSDLYTVLSDEERRLVRKADQKPSRHLLNAVRELTEEKQKEQDAASSRSLRKQNNASAAVSLQAIVEVSAGSQESSTASSGSTTDSSFSQSVSNSRTHGKQEPKRPLKRAVEEAMPSSSEASTTASVEASAHASVSGEVSLPSTQNTPAVPGLPVDKILP